MVNEKRLLDTFLEYIKIDSESKNEKAMGEKLVADLKALGLEVKTDKAGEGFGSNGFNVYAYLPGTLPEDAGEPSIIELDITAMPSITMSVSGSVDENLYTYVENKVVPEFEKLSSVGQVSLSGGQSRRT